ncbi:hypothetical protein [Candidatus Nitrososphaera gargensis]|uniref:hypothetical protein n=1 Tax=Candidatus Nitrososphaera gargensis TaxID=497727 RepID=UPI0011E5556D|nr:hypothetical protein [Candidatus Nitrososphaera gargensis]
MKDRDIKRRHDRHIRKLIRGNETLRGLYMDPDVAKYSAEIESLLEQFYFSGMAWGWTLRDGTCKKVDARILMQSSHFFAFSRMPRTVQIRIYA